MTLFTVKLAVHTALKMGPVGEDFLETCPLKPLIVIVPVTATSTATATNSDPTTDTHPPTHTPYTTAVPAAPLITLHARAVKTDNCTAEEDNVPLGSSTPFATTLYSTFGRTTRSQSVVHLQCAICGDDVPADKPPSQVWQCGADDTHWFVCPVRLAL